MIATTQSLVDELWGFLSPDQRQSLNRNAFDDIAKVYIDFINAHNNDKPKSTHWVCDAAPGHGKTTVLQCVLKHFAKGQHKTPALLVFNNGDTMEDFYKEMNKFGEKQAIPDLIHFIDKDTSEHEREEAFRHLYVCITQQRLRDLALGYGDWSLYSTYTPVVINAGPFAEPPQPVKRMIIIDEMPIFYDECIFDIGTENNAVAWFDDLAAYSNLSDKEKGLGRASIMSMLSTELLENATTTTTPLKHYIADSTVGKRFDEIYSKISKQTVNIDWDTAKYKRWFDRLLNEDGVGCIDRDNRGDTILCSQRIDYRDLGNILILDGTANVTETIYNNEYVMVHVPNRHDYQSRLHIHWRVLNTSAYAKSTGVVYGAVAKDMEEIRNNGFKPFPLVAKADIDQYLSNGVITEQQAYLYEGRHADKSRKSFDIDERLPLNLFNTTGKNDLRDYASIALTSLPVRHPRYYKLKAIGLHGTKIDISMATKGEDRWFRDNRVETIFLELSLAEMLQILHRTQIRDINSSSSVDIFLYHRRKDWIDRLQSSLQIGDSNLTRTELVIHKESFDKKCHERAEQCIEFFHEKGRQSEFDDFASATAFGIGKTSFKKWLTNVWSDQIKRERAKFIFAQYGLEIQQTYANNGEKRIKYKYPD